MRQLAWQQQVQAPRHHKVGPRTIVALTSYPHCPHLRSAPCVAQSWSRCSPSPQSRRLCTGRCACRSQPCMAVGARDVSRGPGRQGKCCMHVCTHRAQPSCASLTQSPCSPVVRAHDVACEQLAVLLGGVDWLGLAICSTGGGRLGPRWAGGCRRQQPSGQVLQATHVQVACGCDAHGKGAHAGHTAARATGGGHAGSECRRWSRRRRQLHLQTWTWWATHSIHSVAVSLSECIRRSASGHSPGDGGGLWACGLHLGYGCHTAFA